MAKWQLRYTTYLNRLIGTPLQVTKNALCHLIKPLLRSFVPGNRHEYYAAQTRPDLPQCHGVAGC